MADYRNNKQSNNNSEQFEKTVTGKTKKVTTPKSNKFGPYKVYSFITTLGFIFILSLLIPFRPTTSEVEKRDLAKFPTFSIQTFFNGDFFDGINNWFSDTFTFKDTFMSLSTNYEKWYGLKGNQITGEITDGEEIPDVSSKPNDSSSTEVVSQPVVGDVSSNGSSSKISSSTESIASDIPSQLPTSSATISQAEQPTNPDTTQALSALLLVGNSAYEYYNFVRSSADSYSSIINKAGERLNGISNVYDIIVPNSMDIMLSESVRSGVNTSDQKKSIDYMYSNINSSVKTVPAYDAIKSHNNEYIYFRTDHHWTALGAYYAYREFCNTKGVAPTELSQYSTVSYGDFLGSFYASSGKKTELSDHPDELIAYKPFNNTSMYFVDSKGTQTNWKVVTDVSSWNKSSKYNAFAGGDNPFTEITNNDKKDGTSCIVVKESYGNAMIPFLVAHYEKVYVVDYRYYKQSLVELAKSKNVNDVIFVNTISTTRASSLVNKIGELVNN